MVNQACKSCCIQAKIIVHVSFTTCCFLWQGSQQFKGMKRIQPDSIRWRRVQVSKHCMLYNSTLHYHAHFLSAGGGFLQSTAAAQPASSASTSVPEEDQEMDADELKVL